VKDVLRRLMAGELTEDEALAELRTIQLEDLAGRARLDLGRYMRRGIPEVILGPGKTPGQAAQLVVTMARRQGQGLVSRMSKDQVTALHAAAREAGMEVIAYSNAARVLRQGFSPEAVQGKIGILTAGTSDVAVADEARMVAEACGLEVRLEADLGVAGLHRFVAPLSSMLDWGADVLVVAAGMDGVLPGLVAGLVALPVIGLPVSTGYGRGGAGEAALLTMLQSCSTGLTLVNIDNGVGAGAAAVLIAQRRLRGTITAATASAKAPTRRTQPSTRAIKRAVPDSPGTPKISEKTSTASRTPTRSQGKPRRGRP
jgi:pyridinium-3,5-biscarboxylic acid mononucleotide synthase